MALGMIHGSSAEKESHCDIEIGLEQVNDPELL
jgi:hypothetical protein